LRRHQQHQPARRGRARLDERFRRLRLGERAGERLEPQGDAVDRTKQAQSADHQGEQARVVRAIDASQLAVRGHHGEGLHVAHGGASVGARGVAGQAFADSRMRGAHLLRGALAGAQPRRQALPRRSRLNLDQSARLVDGEDAVEAGRVERRARADRLAQLVGGKRGFGGHLSLPSIDVARHFSRRTGTAATAARKVARPDTRSRATRSVGARTRRAQARGRSLRPARRRRGMPGGRAAPRR
jgi:hypothetical protein